MKRVLLTLLVALSAAAVAEAQSMRTNPGFNTVSVARNDDGSSGLAPLGFTINFFGKLRSAAYVNNNGNLTFDSPLATFTPFGLAHTEREIIAPFFADVDTRNPISRLVTYGTDVVNGHPAFGANYIQVGYYASHADKLNTFQVVLIDRSDTGEGNFDIEFNYGQIQWETGDASGGTGGRGGVPVVVGWSNGSSDAFELPGSMVSGAFLDGGPRALNHQILTGAVGTVLSNPTAATAGRINFRARDGVIGAGLRIVNGVQLPEAVLGASYNVSLTQSGGKAPFKWVFTPDVSAPPGLTFNANGTISGVPTVPGTYSYTLALTANTEDGDVTVFQRGSIVVRPSQLSILTGCPLDDGAVGQPYSTSLRASGAANFVWSVDNPYALPPGIGLSAAGRFAGTPLLAGTYVMNLRVRSAASDGSVATTSLCRVNIAPATVRIASACSLRATTTVPYSQVLVSDGGQSPYRFTLLGQLPFGMALTADGQIAGTADTAGNYPFQIAVTDALGAQSVRSCNITVGETAFDVSSACPLPGATTGSAYSAKLPSSYTWSLSSGSLPSGLTLSPDGAIAGTPMTAGPARFGLIATDSAGRQAGQACTLSVGRGTLSVSGCPLPDAGSGEPYSTAVTAFGGSAPYYFTLAGRLPAGLDLSTDGLLRGTTTQNGSFDFTVLVRESGGTTTSQACRLNVANPQLRIASACPLPNARLGESYDGRIEAAGGIAPYSFEFAGFLPDGLRGSADGAIRGTPSTLGGRSFVVAVSDSRNQTVSGLCSVNVAIPSVPTVRLATLPSTVASAASNVSVSVELAEPYTQAISGQVSLDVQPDTRSADALANQPDPRLRFSNGQLSAPFTIPAGQTRATLPLSSTGTVASTVFVSISGLKLSGADLPQYPVTQIFRIPAAPPTITSACYKRTTDGVEVTVAGLSNTRELHAAAVIVGIHSFQTDLTGISADYYSSPDTVRAGGTFSLKLPYELVTAPDKPLGDVSIYLSNTVGNTSTRTIPVCQ